VMAGRAGGALTGAIRRSLGRDVGALMERLNRLTGLAAEDLADRGARLPMAAGVITGLGAFLRGYLGMGGWREGRLGLLVALLSGMFPVLSRMRAADVLAARSAATAEAARVSRLPEVVGLAH
jgi:hypothetical protein